MAYSTHEVVSDGTLVLLDIAIEYFDREDITVYFDGVPNAYPWEWVGPSTQRTISFTPAVLNGVVVVVRRNTDISQPRHIFSLGAQFTTQSMDEDLRQVLQIAQEAKEGGWGESTSELREDLALPSGGTLVGHDPATGGNTSVSTELLAHEAQLEALPTPTGSSGVGFIQSGTGAVAMPVQSKLRESVSVKDFGAVGDGVADDTVAFNLAGSSSANPLIYIPPGNYLLNSSPTPSGSVSWYIDADATFAGAGILSGKVIYRGEQPDWLGDYEIAAGLGFKVPDYTNDYILTTENTENLYAKVTGAQTLHSSMIRDYVGLFAVGVNNNTTYPTRVWAGYFEGARLNEVVGATYGIEVEVLNLATTYPITPYTQDAKQAVGIQLGSGAELYDTPGVSKDTSCALNVVGANSKFDKGIIFHDNSIVGTDGLTGTGIAIAFAKGHKMQWYSGAATGTSGIASYSSTTANSASLVFQEGYTRISAGNTVGLQINANSSTVNGVVVACGTAGNSAAISAEGADANINLILAGKGTGSIAFGTYTAGAVGQAGFISIRDSSGTVRRLLVG